MREKSNNCYLCFIIHAGSEAMFADLGHFSYSAIQVISYIPRPYSILHISRMRICILISMLQQVAFTLLVYPALILAYMGQAAYLSQHHHSNHQISFYVSVPRMFMSFLFLMFVFNQKFSSMFLS